MWNGQERRSPHSVAARAVVTAKREAEAIEGAIELERKRRFGSRRRRMELEAALRDVRAVERRCLEALGASVDRAAS